MNLLINSHRIKNNREVAYPIAEEIVDLIINKNINLNTAIMALDIAKEGLGTLVLKKEDAQE
nr:hypothetical protein [uncultured Romboutsia sp.]